MLIVEIKGNESIDRALKVLKSKVIKTKQQQYLFDKKEYVKKSVRKRAQILKAQYTQRIKNS
jgi:small subunit ribosomal protein S21